MKTKLARWISVLTVVPLIAFFILTALFFLKADVFNGSFSWYMFSLCFLTFIPVSAYVLKKVLPGFKEKGREGERKLAFIMGVLGYVLGTIFSFIFSAPAGVRGIFLAYLFSGVILSFVNAVVDHKGSGHACGVSGPLTILVYFLGLRLCYTFLILPVVFWSRLQLGRHKTGELFSGTAIGILATLLALTLNTRLF